jgi:hypothetical protein
MELLEVVALVEEGRSMNIDLTLDELGTINNALNEVCNGLHLEGEFSTRMGCSLEEARALLAKISRIIKLTH